MAITTKRQIRLCKCGCNRQVKMVYGCDGSFKGYLAFAPHHSKGEILSFSWNENRKQAFREKMKHHRQPPACKCGCGKPAREKFYKDGRRNGYGKFSKEHTNREIASLLWTQQRRAKYSKTIQRQGTHNAVPIGTKRKSTCSDGRQYWRIKVPGHKIFMLEHRWIMEQKIGRSLLTSEHVHHLNGDGLDNRPENLQLIPAKEHCAITGNHVVKHKKGLFQFPVCTICKWRHPPHANI